MVNADESHSFLHSLVQSTQFCTERNLVYLLHMEHGLEECYDMDIELI